MALPDARHTTIATSAELVLELIEDLFIQPRAALLRWARVTNQTAQARIAYPGQHLASLITGVPGAGTAARGDDLLDGTEVKSCSRVDQLGECRDCDERVLPYLEECPQCGSTRVNRKENSHWVLSIRTEQELQQCIESPRILLILFDRPPDRLIEIRIRAWEVWPTQERHQYFKWFVEDYWENNFSLKRSRGLNPAPLNLHPLRFDFYMMNPIRVFEARVDSESGAGRILHWTAPAEDRDQCTPDLMPARVVKKALRVGLIDRLTARELADCLGGGASDEEASRLRQAESAEEIAARLTGMSESARLKLPRPKKTPKMTPSSYSRRRQAGGLSPK